MAWCSRSLGGLSAIYLSRLSPRPSTCLSPTAKAGNFSHLLKGSCPLQVYSLKMNVFDTTCWGGTVAFRQRSGKRIIYFLHNYVRKTAGVCAGRGVGRTFVYHYPRVRRSS